MTANKASNASGVSGNSAVKTQLAQAALDWLEARAETNLTLGLGSGSTVNCFVQALAQRRPLVQSVVPASDATAALLKQHALPVTPLAEVEQLSLYIDGADRIDPQLRTIKGGGGALVREKLLATAARFFLCLADSSKRAAHLRDCPLPLEILPSALNTISRHFRNEGARPVLRANYTTDNGNWILDLHGLPLPEPLEDLEQQLASLPGVLDCGLFARRRADLLLTNVEGQTIQAIEPGC